MRPPPPTTTILDAERDTHESHGEEEMYEDDQ